MFSANRALPFCTNSAQLYVGLSAARLPGDFPDLMTVVGVHLTIAQAVSSLNLSRAKISDRLDKLSSVVLNGCSILADSEEGDFQRRSTTDTPIQSPLQGLSKQQQQEYIPELLYATFTVLGLLRQQSASNDEGSMVDTSVAAGWLFSGIAALATSVSTLTSNRLRTTCRHSCEFKSSLRTCIFSLALMAIVLFLSELREVCVQVAAIVREALRQHMKMYLDKTGAETGEDALNRRMGCKMLLTALGDT